MKIAKMSVSLALFVSLMSPLAFTAPASAQFVVADPVAEAHLLYQVNQYILRLEHEANDLRRLGGKWVNLVQKINNLKNTIRTAANTHTLLPRLINATLADIDSDIQDAQDANNDAQGAQTELGVGKANAQLQANIAKQLNGLRQAEVSRMQREQLENQETLEMLRAPGLQMSDMRCTHC